MASRSNMEQSVWLESVINKKLNEKSIASVIDIDVKAAVPEGNNFTSVITRAKLTVLLRSGEKSKISVIIKNEHSNQQKADTLKDFPNFKNEIKAYSEILSQCERIMAEYEDQNEKLWCDMVAYKRYNVIVFEDLKVQNYALAEHKILDLNHSKLVLHNLGRLHGLCHVLMKQGLLTKDDTSPYYSESESPVVKNMYIGSLKQLGSTIEQYWPPEWKQIGQRLHKQHEVAAEKVKSLFTIPDDCFVTLCHGDCWTPNMLFKYCPFDKNYPTSHKFIDFQAIHTNSSIFDLMHFLGSSVHPEVRRKHFDDLLNTYTNSLRSTLAIYGMEEHSPTSEQINKEFQRTEYYGFMMAVLVFPVLISNIKDAFKLEYLNEGCDPADAFNPELYKTEEFMSAIQPDLKRWFENGLF